MKWYNDGTQNFTLCSNKRRPARTRGHHHPQLMCQVPGMFNGKFLFSPSHMASNFCLRGISHMGIPRKFPRFGNFLSLGNFPFCGNVGNSCLTGHSHFLSAHISDSYWFFALESLFYRIFNYVCNLFCLAVLIEILFFKEGGDAKW